MGDRRADTLVITGLGAYASLIAYALYRDPTLAVISAILVAVISIGAVWWLGDD